MSPQEQQKAIAEACGWSLKHCEYHNAVTWHSPDGICAEGSSEEVLPDYLNCLNACQEMRRSLTSNEHQFYYSHLEQIINGEPYDGESLYGAGWLYRNVDALPSEHCEAFLRTKGLWKD